MKNRILFFLFAAYCVVIYFPSDALSARLGKVMTASPLVDKPFSPANSISPQVLDGRTPAEAMTQPEADVYEEPDTKSKVIERIPVNSEIEASNFPVMGFHKVRTQSGKVGYIEAKLLNLDPLPSSEKLKEAGAPDPEAEHKRELEAQRIAEESSHPGLMSKAVWIKGFGSMNFYNASGIVLNYNNISNGFGYGNEVIAMVSDRFGLGFRFESLGQSVSLTDQSTSKSYSVQVNSIPVMGGAEYTLLRSSHFTIQLGCFLGVGFQTGLTVVDTTDSPATGSTYTMYSTNFASVEKLEIHWHFSRWFSTFIEGGYRYLNSSQFTPPSGTLSTLVLNPSFNVNLSGMFGSLGLALSF